MANNEKKNTLSTQKCVYKRHKKSVIHQPVFQTAKIKSLTALFSLYSMFKCFKHSGQIKRSRTGRNDRHCWAFCHLSPEPVLPELRELCNCRSQVNRRDKKSASVNTHEHVSKGALVSTLCLAETTAVICIITSRTNSRTHSLWATRTQKSREIRKQNLEWWGNNGVLEGSFAFLRKYFRLIVTSDKETWEIDARGQITILKLLSKTFTTAYQKSH